MLHYRSHRPSAVKVFSVRPLPVTVAGAVREDKRTVLHRTPVLFRFCTGRRRTAGALGRGYDGTHPAAYCIRRV